MDKRELLQKYLDLASHNLLCYSRNYLMNEPKDGYENEWQQANEECKLLDEMKKEAALAGQPLSENQVTELSSKDLECIARYIQAYVRTVFHEENDVPIPCERCPHVTEGSNCQPWTAFRPLSKVTGIKISPLIGSMCSE